MRSDLTHCRVVGEGLCAEKRVKGNAAKSKLNLCFHQMMNNLPRNGMQALISCILKYVRFCFM